MLDKLLDTYILSLLNSNVDGLLALMGALLTYFKPCNDYGLSDGPNLPLNLCLIFLPGL